MNGLNDILAQLAPAVTTETVLFTVPATRKGLIGEIIICNRQGSPASFRISISQLGAATTAKDYLYFDFPIVGNDTFSTDLGVTLNATDVMRVYAGSANLTFTLFGSLS